MEKNKCWIAYIYEGKKLTEVVVHAYEFKFSKKVKSKRSADLFAQKVIQVVEDYIREIISPMFEEYKPD